MECVRTAGLWVFYENSRLRFPYFANTWSDYFTRQNKKNLCFAGLSFEWNLTFNKGLRLSPQEGPTHTHTWAFCSLQSVLSTSPTALETICRKLPPPPLSTHPLSTWPGVKKSPWNVRPTSVQVLELSRQHFKKLASGVLPWPQKYKAPLVVQWSSAAWVRTPVGAEVRATHTVL